MWLGWGKRSHPISVSAQPSLMQQLGGALLPPLASNLRFCWFPKAISFLSWKGDGRMVSIPSIFTSRDKTECSHLYFSSVELTASTRRSVTATLPSSYLWNTDHSSMHVTFMTKTQMADENQENLELDDQEEATTLLLVKVFGKLYWADTEMDPLGLTIRCEYWLNADHSSMPFSWFKNGWLLKTKKILNSITKDATTLLLEFAAS